MSEERVDLAYIGQALHRLTTEVASLRDDMGVLTAIVTRLDHSHARLLEEIRATHSQVARLASRVRAIDDRLEASRTGRRLRVRAPCKPGAGR
jgi:phage shock protein A